MSVYWKDEPWVQVNQLVADLEKVYEQGIRAGKIVSPTDTAVRKLMHYRGWCGAVPQDALRRVIEQLEIVYVPRGIGPGPGLLFPIRDLTGEVVRLHIRLLEDGPDIYKMKYMSLIDDKESFLGPAWIGADEATLTAIIKTGEVLIVEGPLDLAAVRILDCPIPSLSSTNKKLSDDHWDYLRVLGVKTLYPMLDNEQSKVGEKAADWMTRNPYGIKVVPCTCPTKDPSAALEHTTTLTMLRAALPAPVRLTFSAIEF
jgi:hypothetical protein